MTANLQLPLRCNLASHLPSAEASVRYECHEHRTDLVEPRSNRSSALCLPATALSTARRACSSASGTLLHDSPARSCLSADPRLPPLGSSRATVSSKTIAPSEPGCLPSTSALSSEPKACAFDQELTPLPLIQMSARAGDACSRIHREESSKSRRARHRTFDLVEGRLRTPLSPCESP